MNGLDVFAFVVMAVLGVVAIYMAFLLGALPGRIAAERGHPQADAIRVAGWVGLLTLGLAWPLALIWAYTRPSAGGSSAELDETARRLTDRVAALEADRGTGNAGGGAGS